MATAPLLAGHSINDSRTIKVGGSDGSSGSGVGVGVGEEGNDYGSFDKTGIDHRLVYICIDMMAAEVMMV
jgi:hypothetical protein